MTLTFENQTFKTKTAAIMFLKSYLNTHESIPDSDYPLITAFMKHHPRGLKSDEHITIVPNCIEYPNIRCFAVVEADGTIDKRSYRAIINGYDQKQDVNHCLRWLIKPQIDEWKTLNTMPETCPLCHKPLDHPHVDHILPFRTILSDFLHESHIKIEDIEIVRETGKDKYLKDKALGQKFYDYHKEHATLRYLCAHCNIKRR